MSKNRLPLLLGVLVVLLGVAYLTGVFERNASTVDLPEVEVPADALEQLRIEAPAQTVALVRDGSRWRIAEPLTADADSAAVARFVDTLGSLALASTVSTSPERHARYGVDSAATVVTATWPGGTRRLVVGGPSTDRQAVYVRLDDDPNVYVTRQRLTLPPNLDGWRDKVILDLAASAVASAQVQRPDGAFEVRRGPGGWQLVAGDEVAPADSAAVAGWLQRFAPLKADGFMDDVPTAILDSTAYQVAFRTTAGTTETLRLLQSGDDVAATNTAGAVTYRLRAGRLDLLLPDPQSLE